LRSQVRSSAVLYNGSLLSCAGHGYFGFSFAKFFEAISHVTYHVKGEEVTKNFLEPGLKFGTAVTNGWGPLDLVSLGLALVFGTAGLPHILVRFYTVPDAKTARISVVWAMLIIGAFYIMTTFLGFGAATILTPDRIVVDGKPNDNMARSYQPRPVYLPSSAVALPICPSLPG
jgi:cation/acetate symporter